VNNLLFGMMSIMTDSFFANMQLLGRYEIRGRIGAGGMARVFKGYDANLDRIVAIKILHDHLADDPNFKERFEREAKFVASFNHPNIVQIYDFNSVEIGDQRIYYMVMPYVPGNTLKDVLDETSEKGERLPHERVLEIMLTLTDALGYAHERGMVHRDIKPANILFNERQQAVLSDFGIARLVQNSKLTQDGVTTGTPGYMSPEQVAGMPVDARSDIYALGVILFEMLAGQLPFSDPNPVSLMLKHVNAPIPHISSFLEAENPALDAIIFKAMSKDVSERYTSTQELADDLANALGSEPRTPAKPPNYAVTTQVMDSTEPLPEQTSKSQTRAYRSPLGILAIGMTLIALLTAIALFTMRGSSSPSRENVPSMTGSESVYFTSTFASDSEYNRYWPQGETSELSQAITEDGFYRLTNPNPATAATSLFDPAYSYDDAVITISGQLENSSQPSSAFGIVFHYLDADNYNVFAVDGVGRFSIWVRENGVWRELRNASDAWTPDAAIQPIGNDNVLRLEANGGHYLGYINDMLVADVLDSTLENGHIGIYLATPREGTATVLIDSYQVAISSSSVPSMTGDEKSP
jgi:serine/threonine protein kinase